MPKLLFLTFLLWVFASNCFAGRDCVAVVAKDDVVSCAFDISGLIVNDELETHFLNADQLHKYLVEKSPAYSEYYKGIPTIFAAGKFNANIDLLIDELIPAGKTSVIILDPHKPLQDGGGDGNGGGSGGW